MRLIVCLLCVLGGFARDISAQPLPNTKLLTTDGDLAKLMVDGIHKYLDRELEAAPAKRWKLWEEAFKNTDALTKAIPAKRERLKQILGVVDPRVPSKLEYVGGPDRPSLVAEVDGCRIHAVRWAVLNGVDAEGLLIEPKDKPKANVVAVPHADQHPEQVAGLTSGDDFGLRLARHGCRVLIPTLINRDDEYSGNARLKKWTNDTHREWIHRMCYEMGRTVPGFEVQKVLAAVEWFEKQDAKLKIGVIGYGDGGMIALYAGALDERIAVTQSSAYFGPREKLWEEPIDRNVWDRLPEFGDAEIAAMIGPREFIFEPLADDEERKGFWPTWKTSTAKPGRTGTAPGFLAAVRQEAVVAEGARFDALLNRKSALKVQQTDRGIRWEQFCDRLAGEPLEWVKYGAPEFRPIVTDPVARHKRQFDQLAALSQNLWRHSEPVRREFWKKADASSPEKWEQSCEWYRDYFHEEAIGKLPEPTPTVPLNPRTRPIYDEPKWTGHEVMLDVFPDVFAYGILLLPKGMKPGERRPVVVCQHGLSGRPTDVCNPKERTKFYNSFGAQLADRGYIVFAPQNPYIFEDHFRQILRKANPLKLSLFSFIIRQHQRILDWLETQPNVDPKRIAFYGLSYGGKTAMRVPAVEKRYCLSICSGDFNEWIGKIVSTELPMSYMFTREYDMLEFNLGHTFNYAEMANLIAPRPFMVERGHDDGVGTDEMIAYEYAKVRYLYENKLKIGDRTELEFFVGGHEIHGKGTFAFLDKHLKWLPK
ncbi:alpha/beta hydrolase family protein [Limnoglobus roseus]|uniref:Alpha/beta hydrolase n=1 Tax=Limnoglobus roseus TaxID=2598579 RepID=A0A5C1A9Z0_9BACT|nr:dienelactone hydrolase family protein [Limnoglobus roseus]QEL16199.1 alpha/beta hydrolase [Limnoglobus roseus]